MAAALRVSCNAPSLIVVSTSVKISTPRSGPEKHPNDGVRGRGKPNLADLR